jgi:hypothetical protein
MRIPTGRNIRRVEGDVGRKVGGERKEYGTMVLHPNMCTVASFLICERIMSTLTLFTI